MQSLLIDPTRSSPRSSRPVVRGVACVLLLASFACSDSPAPPFGDITPPAVVTDLRVHSTSSDAVTLLWTAPGDDGQEGRAAAYDLRRARATITEANWDSVSTVAATSLPQSSGNPELLVVPDLAPGTWYFAIRTADEVPNWSGLSNVISAEVADLEPPAAVTDLAVSSVGLRTIEVSWTAPGADGNEGMASVYELRFATHEITEEAWEDAASAPDVPVPAPAGTRQTAAIAGLDPRTSYFVGLRSRDLANWSAISNVVTATTESAYRLTQSPAERQAYHPSWSPDGTSIAYSANDENSANRQIYVVAAEGGEPERVTDVAGQASWPRWSPDGTRIACAIGPSPDGVPLELWVLDPSGEADALLLASHAPQNVTFPSWSPDGSQIAYQVSETGEILIVSSGGGPSTVLVPAAGFTRGLSWSPQGDRLVFASNRGGTWDLWTVPVTGGVPVPITNDAAFERGPVWSPDGAWISFDSDRASTRPGIFDVWVMAADGSRLRQITSGVWDQSGASWSPDGSRLAYQETVVLETGGATANIWVLYLPDLLSAW